MAYNRLAPGDNTSYSRPQSQSNNHFQRVSQGAGSSRPSVSDLAKALEAPPVARFAPPGSQFSKSRDTSPTRSEPKKEPTVQIDLLDQPLVSHSEAQAQRTSALAHPGLPSLNSFQQYQAQMQDIRNQQTGYMGAGGMSGGEGTHMPYEDGQRRMAEYRQQRNNEMPPPQSRPYHKQDNLIPMPPPHTYAHSRRSVESSPERGYSPARSYRDERSPSPTKYRSDQPYMHSYSSSNNLMADAAAPGVIALGDRPSSRVSQNRPQYGSRPGSYYRDNASDAGSAYTPSVLTPNNAASAGLGTIDPMDIADDDLDDPIIKSKKPGSVYGNSMLGFGNGNTGGAYSSVPGGGEKGFSSSFSRQPPKKKKSLTMMQGIFWGLAILIVAGIIAGVVGFVLVSQKANNKDAGAEAGASFSLFGGGGGASSNSNSSSSTNGTSSSSGNSGLTKSSPEIVALLNNDKLHKVFPGIDYTPQNTQWPDCLSNPPSQDNVTMDIAIISQLSPTVRLYGTDCNQTEMVLEAINALDLQSSLKLWGAIWLEDNSTTNSRQTEQMYDVLSTYGTSQFEGIIVGNEVLFRKDMTETQLIADITNFRNNITKLYPNADLKIATSDIGSSWDSTLAEAVDVVMSNIHPFFAGVPDTQAASWTWQYWQNTDIPVSQGLTGKEQIIAETGWPTQGGNDCGSGVTCSSSTAGSVASIEGLNLFLSEWVCSALTNGTNYFWFEILDESWKAIYNTATSQVETNWGLFDDSRTLKDNVTIPSCGGQTAS